METRVTFKVSIVLRFLMTELENRHRIAAKATELFMQYGIRTVSMDDIASAMGMSKKTIYQSFADKDELVLEVIGGEVKKSETHCNCDREDSDNAVEELFKAMDMVEEMFSNMNPSVIYDLQKYHAKAFEVFLKHKNKYLYNVIRENLQWGIKEGLYREELNIDLIASFRLECMMMPFDPSFLQRNKTSIAQTEHALTEHYLFGIVTLKGYKLILKYQQKRNKTALNEKTK
jgi:TetR/AcrR family transcriptional regulator, cholesterol catabolism regulator